MDMKKTIFSLAELNNESWGNVLLVNIQHSSGMGGWGCLWIVTKEPKLYFIGFEGFPYDERKLDEFAPLFKKSQNPQHQYAVEENGWKYIGNRKILIRDDFYEVFLNFYQDEDRWARGGYYYMHVPDIAAKALGVERLERINYEVSDKIIDKGRKERECSALDKEQLYLTEEDFLWKELYPNNQKTMFLNGEYALLFKKHDEQVEGYRFSIIYQRKEMEPLQWKGLNEIEAYNLYEKKYEKIEGPLYYGYVQEKEIDYNFFNEPWITLNQYEINDYGKFTCSFRIMEEAKNYVVKKVNFLRYVTKENIIKELGGI